MVVLTIDRGALAGNCQIVVPRQGENLRAGDRVELVCPGIAVSLHGIVLDDPDDLDDAWSVWVVG